MTVKEFQALDSANQCAILDGCKDPLTAESLSLRRCRFSWTAVSVHLGGIDSPDGCRMRCARYLKRI